MFKRPTKDIPLISTTRSSLACSLAVGSAPAKAQECTNTPDGLVCKVQQGLVAGTVVATDTQKNLGLVTVAGGCSGTLLNRSWVLTADHCVNVGNYVAGKLPNGLIAPTVPTAGRAQPRMFSSSYTYRSQKYSELFSVSAALGRVQ